MSNSMKIRPVGAEFHEDGPTDMTKLRVAFRNFANAHNYGKIIQMLHIFISSM